MPKVSIIIPVYRAELYLSKCVDSIISQTFLDWELLLVEDGSPDRSGEICDEYARRDSRIRVFHKPNGGVSSARNLGLKNATGEWITFVDADDWISQQTLETCSSYFSTYDVIRFSMKIVNDERDESKNRYRKLKYNTEKGEIIDKVLSRSSLLCVCGGVYKSELFQRTNIQFDTTLIMAEDWLVLLKLLAGSKSIVDLPEVFYFYNQLNEVSCSNNPTVRKIENCLQAMGQICKIKGIEGCGYEKSITTGWCVIWKAMIRGLIINEQTSNNFITRINMMRERYYFPKLNNILSSHISLIHKFFLAMSLIRPTQIIIYLLLKKISYER